MGARERLGELLEKNMRQLEHPGMGHGNSGHWWFRVPASPSQQEELWGSVAPFIWDAEGFPHMRSINAKSQVLWMFTLFFVVKDSRKDSVTAQVFTWLRAPGRACNLASRSGSCMVQRCRFWNRFQVVIRIYTCVSFKPPNSTSAPGTPLPSLESLSWLLASPHTQLLESPAI